MNTSITAPIRASARPKRTAATLQDEIRTRDYALDHLTQGICVYGPDAVMRFANARYAEVLDVDPALPRPGATMREMLAASIAAGHHGERSLDALEAACWALIQDRKPRLLATTLGSGRLVSFRHEPLPDGGWLAIFEDITERTRLEERATFLARHDALTRLPNRTMLGEHLELALAATGRGSRFGLVCINIDHFKAVNDTLGHAHADQLLRVVGERLSACVRETDCVARLGGDEFAIVQTDIAGAEDSVRLAQRIALALAQPIALDQHRLAVTASIGIALGPEDGTRAEVLLQRADAAMDRARADGGGTCRLFEPETDARVQARHAMELDLRQALATASFELHYQPQVEMATATITGYEALLRWRRPDGSSVSPAVFIPLAEETGLIGEIGEWVLHAACREAARWPAPLRVAVNVSPAQFKGERLAAAVAAALAASGLAAHRLELEITESVLLAENPANLAVLQGLRDLGVRVALDDFGTGYASLSYLRGFPFDAIKIDQSFVREPDSAVIVGAMIGLGHALGMRVTAEGVETAEQRERLRAAGCDEAQGYLFGRPAPATTAGAPPIDPLRGSIPAKG
jgi:diguanylate cyclase (GGDEF)-like protein